MGQTELEMEYMACGGLCFPHVGHVLHDVLIAVIILFADETLTYSSQVLFLRGERIYVTVLHYVLFVFLVFPVFVTVCLQCVC